MHIVQILMHFKLWFHAFQALQKMCDPEARNKVANANGSTVLLENWIQMKKQLHSNQGQIFVVEDIQIYDNLTTQGYVCVFPVIDFFPEIHTKVLQKLCCDTLSIQKKSKYWSLMAIIKRST